MERIKPLLESLKAQLRKPLITTAWTLFAGALGKELCTTLETGKIDLSVKSFESMAAAAVSTTIIALVHLYLSPPNTTPATPPKETP